MTLTLTRQIRSERAQMLWPRTSAAAWLIYNYRNDKFFLLVECQKKAWGVQLCAESGKVRTSLPT